MHKIEMSETPLITVFFEGQALKVKQSENVAAALLSNNQLIFRTTPVTGASRGPYCMMGVCFDCLVEINGNANRQACMTQVEDGMRINRQNGAGDTRLEDLGYEAQP